MTAVDSVSRSSQSPVYHHVTSQTSFPRPRHVAAKPAVCSSRRSHVRSRHLARAHEVTFRLIGDFGIVRAYTSANGSDVSAYAHGCELLTLIRSRTRTRWPLGCFSSTA